MGIPRTTLPPQLQCHQCLLLCHHQARRYTGKRVYWWQQMDFMALALEISCSNTWHWKYPPLLTYVPSSAAEKELFKQQQNLLTVFLSVVWKQPSPWNLSVNMKLTVMHKLSTANSWRPTNMESKLNCIRRKSKRKFRILDWHPPGLARCNTSWSHLNTNFCT